MPDKAPTVPIGLTGKSKENASIIYRNPEAVEEVIREVEENEDIPTKTAVINKVIMKVTKSFE